MPGHSIGLAISRRRTRLRGNHTSMHDTSSIRSPSNIGTRRVLHLLAIAMVVLGLVGTQHAGEAQGTIAPPEQPASGPGGRDYRFDGVTAARVGTSPSGVWVYAPEAATSLERRSLPVVVFLHGFGATDPITYLGWIEHLVRRGSLVIYPDYQPPGFLGGGQEAYLGNTFAGVADGIMHVGATPERVHVVGHSLGAVLTAAYGALAPAADLPPAATLTMIEPGGCRNCGNFGAFGVLLPLERRIPEDTLVRTVVGAEDGFVGDADARSIQQMLGTIPADRKTFESVQSDDHGSPPLVADHLFPQTGRTGSEADALDWFGLWRPFDALMNCADRQEDCEIALGTSREHLFMGEWSDGTPVTSPVPIG